VESSDGRDGKLVEKVVEECSGGRQACREDHPGEQQRARRQGCQGELQWRQQQACRVE
jgi:hypothetical protein